MASQRLILRQRRRGCAFAGPADALIASQRELDAAFFLARMLASSRSSSRSMRRRASSVIRPSCSSW